MHKDKIFICVGRLICACGISLAFPHFFFTFLHLSLPADHQEIIHRRGGERLQKCFNPVVVSRVVVSSWITGRLLFHLPPLLPLVQYNLCRSHGQSLQTDCTIVKMCPCSHRNIAAASLQKQPLLYDMIRQR